jgi:hypothetical protein
MCRECGLDAATPEDDSLTSCRHEGYCCWCGSEIEDLYCDIYEVPKA